MEPTRTDNSGQFQSNDSQWVGNSFSTSGGNIYINDSTVVRGNPSGLGGVGKTQLIIAYIRKRYSSYDSIFWLTAASESSLKYDLRQVACRVSADGNLEGHNDEQVLRLLHRWCSNNDSPRWLLVFDNYDEPQQFELHKYWPYTAHGSIIVTTRVPHLMRFSARHLRLQPLSNVGESLDILEKRSGRSSVKTAPDAHKLAKPFAGIPLALATAGAFLSQSISMTFRRYLQAYQRSWGITLERAPNLYEYQDRTLYNTWTLSYNQLANRDPDAAELLKLLAYFDNRQIWHALLDAGDKVGVPPSFEQASPAATLVSRLSDSLRRCVDNAVRFDRTMSTLVQFCFVQVHPNSQSYTVHKCVHDWTLGELNRTIDTNLYWYAFSCIYRCIKVDEMTSLSQLQYARFVPHAIRLTHHRFAESKQIRHLSVNYRSPATWIAVFLMEQAQFSTAEQLYEQTLASAIEHLGPDHQNTLIVIYNLGLLHQRQGKLYEAEKDYKQALVGYRKTLGSDHESTLDAICNLGMLYRDQGRLGEAEQTLELALQDYAKVSSANKTSDSLIILLHALSQLYYSQGKLEEAEQVCQRALVNCETTPWQDKQLLSSRRRYAETLCLSVRVMKLDTRATASRIATLAELGIAEANFDSRFLQYLGDTLVFVRDDQNAQVAYYLAARKVEGGHADFHSRLCDERYCTLTVGTGCHICRHCPGVHLCDALHRQDVRWSDTEGIGCETMFWSPIFWD